MCSFFGHVFTPWQHGAGRRGHLHVIGIYTSISRIPKPLKPPGN